MDYQDLNFKSHYEKTKNKLPTSKQDSDFRENFVKVFHKQRVSDVKSMMMLNKDEESKFDFIFPGKELVDSSFFSDLKLFDEKQEINLKLNHLMDFLQNKYGVITPDSLHESFKFFYQNDKAPSVAECRNMLYLFFNKYQINLNDEYDRERFIKFFEKIHKNENSQVRSNNSNYNLIEQNPNVI